MADRLANSSDVSTYASFGVQLNDFIADTNENTTTRSTFHNMPVDFPGLRTAATIWLKNPAEGSRYSQRFAGNGTNWGGGSLSSPNKFRVLDQNFFTKNPINTNDYLFEVQDCQYLDLSGYHPSFKGMRDPNFGSYPENFFGVVMNKTGFAGDGTNMFSLKGDLKAVTISDWFTRDGFAKIRVQPDNTSVLDWVRIYNCWGEGGSGEGYYILKTNGTGGATPLATNYHVANCVSFWSGAEGFQLQDMMQGTAWNLVENCLMLFNSTEWKAPFLAAQGSAFQLRYDEGKIIVRNCIIWAWGQNAVNLQFNILGDPAVNNGQIIFDNCLIIDGQDRCVLLNTTDQNCPIIMQRCDFGHIQEEYSVIGAPQALEQINIFHLIDYTIKNCRYVNDRTFYIEEEIGFANNTNDVSNSGVASIDRPDFINSGFPEPGYALDSWAYETSSGVPSPGIPIDYVEGRITRFKIILEVYTVDTSSDEVIKTAHGYSNGKMVKVETTNTVPGGLATATLYYIVNATTNRFQLSTTEGGAPINITSAGSGVQTFWVIDNPNYGRYYKCISAHSGSEATRPDRDTTNWEVLSWDESEVRSDDPSWNVGDTQNYNPPRNVLFSENSDFEMRGRKLGLSIGATDYTEYQWQVSVDSRATWEDIPFPGARNAHFNYSEIGYEISGKSFRRIITSRSTLGVEYSSTSAAVDIP